ncbi:MAG: VanZ family protein [Anaerolineaceae bacterium]|nr:VanZ family protein [Anaerolineaceae bacterium]
MLFGGIIIVFLTTLYPFNFQTTSLSNSEYLGGYSLSAGPYSDIPLNIILFIPYSLGLTKILEQQSKKIKRLTFALVVAAGLTLTLLVEFLQLALPDRTATLSDILSNTFGAGVGYYFYQLFKKRVSLLARVKPIITNTRLLSGGLLGYLLVLLLSAYWIKSGFQLGDWETNFHLVLGNEKTQDRPWQGEINNLGFFDRALSVDEIEDLFTHSDAEQVSQEHLITFYPITGVNSLSDQVGNSPHLQWKSLENDSLVDTSSNLLDGKHWLETELPVTSLNKRLLASSEFTLFLTVTVLNIDQYGPARILSIGENTFQQNLVIGQNGADLVMRVRAPFTGESGTVPQWTVRNIFINNATYRLVITYDGVSAQVFINDSKVASKIDVIPGAFLGVLLFSPNVAQVNALTSRLLSILFYFLVLTPFTVLLALLVIKVKRKFLNVLLLTSGIVVPSLLLEIIFSTNNSGNFRVFYLLIGILIEALVFGCLALALKRKSGFIRNSCRKHQPKARIN